MSEQTLKTLVGALAVVAVLWVVATLVSSGGGEIEFPTEMGDIFEGVEPTTVSVVRFVRPEDTLQLAREGETWRINGFRADSGSVARFFTSVGEASVGDLVATNPANHERMGVSADSARVLEMEVGGETRSVLIGNAGPRATTAYARMPGQDEVYLLEGSVRAHVTRQLEDWRNRRMTQVDTSLVSRIAVQRDGDSYAVVRGDSAWTFEDGGAVEGSQVRSILDQLAGALVAAGFVADGDSLAALPPAGSTSAYSESGEVLAEVTIGEGSGERWAMAAGDSIRYRIAAFRVNLITPTRESVTPE